MQTALSAVKEKMFSLLMEPTCADSASAMTGELSENSRPGFAGENPALFLGQGVCNSTTALGLRGTLFLSGIRSRCTGKERDTESGLDNFGARYDASSLARFMTPDPVVITPERLYDPQQLNGYSYVRNNPLRFLDPTGMTLTVSGNAGDATQDLCTIAGSACDRIAVDQKTGTVSFNTEGLDLSKNEGAALLNDVVTSQSHYDFSVGAAVETAGGMIHIDHLVNLDNNYDQRYDIRKPPGKVATEKPKAGVNDQIGLNPKADVRSDTKLKPATQDSVAFHELAEAYSKVDHSKQYSDAHQEAIQREQKLRDQCPYLKDNNPGSGPGDRIIIKR